MAVYHFNLLLMLEVMKQWIYVEFNGWLLEDFRLLVIHQ